MEATISKLLNRFERGVLTRRGLIQALTMLTAASATLSDAQGQDVIKVVRVDHVGIQVSDLPRSVAFYEKVFGLTLESDDKNHPRLGVGKGTLVSLHQASPAGLVNHVAIAVENFDKDPVARELKQRGANPLEDRVAGFHVQDPDGVPIQIVGA